MEEQRNPQMLDLFRERIVLPRRAAAVMVLQRGIERGEIRSDAKLDVVVEMSVGAFIARHLMGLPESPEHIASVVDVVWSGLAIDR